MGWRTMRYGRLSVAGHQESSHFGHKNRPARWLHDLTAIGVFTPKRVARQLSSLSNVGCDSNAFVHGLWTPAAVCHGPRKDHMPEEARMLGRATDRLNCLRGDAKAALSTTAWHGVSEETSFS